MNMMSEWGRRHEGGDEIRCDVMRGARGDERERGTATF